MSRNLDDEQLQWMKTNGGVVQTVALGEFVNNKKADERNAKLQPVRCKLQIPWVFHGMKPGRKLKVNT